MVRQRSAIPDLSATVPRDPALTTVVLPNGFRVHHMHCPVPPERIFMRLVVEAGSLHEAVDQRGAAHFVEHLCFRGTTAFDHNTIYSLLSSLGASLGADYNAVTHQTHTHFDLVCPDNDPRVVAMCLMVMAQWASAVKFNQQNVLEERSVILEEWRLTLGPQAWGAGVVEDALKGTPFSDRSPIGTETVLRNITPARLRAFYTDNYVPKRMHLVIVGDFSRLRAAEVIMLAGNTFSGIPEPAPAKALANPEPWWKSFTGLTDGPRCVVGASISPSSPDLLLISFIGVDVPTGRLQTGQDRVDTVVKSFAHLLFTGRLNEEFRNIGVSLTVDSFPLALPNFTGLVITAEPRDVGKKRDDATASTTNVLSQRLRDTVVKVLQVQQRLRLVGVQRGELSNALSMARNMLETHVESSPSIVQDLTDSIVGGNLEWFNDHSTPAAAQAADYSANVFPFVTQAAVQRALFRVLDPCCMSVQVYVQGDEEKKGQAQAELAALVASTLAEAAAGERAASAGAGAGSSAGGSSEGDDSAPVDLVALATAHLHTLHPAGKQGVDTARLGASALTFKRPNENTLETVLGNGIKLRVAHGQPSIPKELLSGAVGDAGSVAYLNSCTTVVLCADGVGMDAFEGMGVIQGDVGHFLLQCLSAFLSTSGVGGLTGSQWRSMCVCNALLIDATVGPTRTELTLRGSRKHLEDMLGFVALLHGPTATRQVPENKSQFETCLSEIRDNGLPAPSSLSHQTQLDIIDALFRSPVDFTVMVLGPFGDSAGEVTRNVRAAADLALKWLAPIPRVPIPSPADRLAKVMSVVRGVCALCGTSIIGRGCHCGSCKATVYCSTTCRAAAKDFHNCNSFSMYQAAMDSSGLLVTEYAGTAERADVSICFPVRLSDFAGGMDVTVGTTYINDEALAKIRLELGMTYNIVVGQLMERGGRVGVTSIQFSCDPSQARKVIRATLTLCRSLCSKLPSQTAVDAVAAKLGRSLTDNADLIDAATEVDTRSKNIRHDHQGLAGCLREMYPRDRVRALVRRLLPCGAVNPQFYVALLLPESLKEEAVAAERAKARRITPWLFLAAVGVAFGTLLGSKPVARP